tara:strand:- start:4505 stop:5101 length:597 start_codon:yes stop_codon:yes gene_type:complete
MFNHVHLKNPGLTISTLPRNIFEGLMSEIKEIEKSDAGYLKMNNSLAGQIKKEYQLKKSQEFMNPFLEEMARQYGKHFDYYPDYDFKVDSLWVNYQSKTEYNPIHNHDGLLSFVIWMQIPYNIENEYQVPHSQNSTLKTASAFQFVYSSVLGNILNERLEVTNGWEGRIVMFPSKLLHTVYPFFTSDNYRISVAGNIS